MWMVLMLWSDAVKDYGLESDGKAKLKTDRGDCE